MKGFWNSRINAGDPRIETENPCESHDRFGDEETRLMHLVPAPAVRLMKRRVLSKECQDLGTDPLDNRHYSQRNERGKGCTHLFTRDYMLTKVRSFFLSSCATDPRLTPFSLIG